MRWKLHALWLPHGRQVCLLRVETEPARLEFSLCTIGEALSIAL